MSAAESDVQSTGAASLQPYFAAAASWDQDRRVEALRAARRAWWVAGAAAVVAAVAVAAVALLTPLKSVQPFVVRVDNATGVVDVVPELARAAEPAELVTRYLLHSFVAARERYVYAMAESDYALVGAAQSPALNQLWFAAWDRGNPDSPLNRYRDGTTVRVQVKAITFLTRANGVRDMAQVRFLTATRLGGSGAEQLAHWIATLQYRYRAAAKDPAQRALNPLGFRVLEYRREPEVLPKEATRVAQQDARGARS